MGRSWWNATKLRRAEAERLALTPAEIEEPERLAVGAAPTPVPCLSQAEMKVIEQCWRV